MRRFFLILLLFIISLYIIRLFPLAESKIAPNIKESEEGTSISAPSENLSDDSDETQRIYCPPEDETDGMENTDHEWLYIN